MDIKIKPSVINGTICPPHSKSILHRVLICAAFSENKTSLEDIVICDDISATIDCLAEFGVCINSKLKDNGKSDIFINPQKNNYRNNVLLNCRGSASALHFLIPVIAATGYSVSFCGFDILGNRIKYNSIKELGEHGCGLLLSKYPFNLKINGKINSGKYHPDCSETSQYASGLILAAPLMRGKTEITIDNNSVSMPYIKMTLEVIKMFASSFTETNNVITIDGGNGYHAPKNLLCERDWSAAAFLFAAGLSSGEVGVLGLGEISLQGDYEIVNILKKAGADFDYHNGIWTAKKSKLKPFEINAANIPDLIPPIAAIAALGEGETVIYNAERLRTKESDRIFSVCNMLTSLGADAKETSDGIIIRGVKNLTGGITDSFGDHRIVMAAAAIAPACLGEVIIKNCEAVNKSYPEFFSDMLKLGLNFEIL